MHSFILFLRLQVDGGVGVGLCCSRGSWGFCSSDFCSLLCSGPDETCGVVSVFSSFESFEYSSDVSSVTAYVQKIQVDKHRQHLLC